MMPVLVALILLGSIAMAADHSSDTPRNAPPDVIFVNGDIFPGATFTTSGSDRKLVAKPVGPRAQAIAVRDGRVVAIGSNADIRKLKTGHTKEIDLGRHFVMP